MFSTLQHSGTCICVGEKLRMALIENIPGTNAPNYKQRCFQGGKEHVEKTVDHKGIGDGAKVILNHELTIDKRTTCRCL